MTITSTHAESTLTYKSHFSQFNAAVLKNLFTEHNY